MKKLKVKMSEWSQDMQKYQFMKGHVNLPEDLKVQVKALRTKIYVRPWHILEFDQQSGLFSLKIIFKILKIPICMSLVFFLILLFEIESLKILVVFDVLTLMRFKIIKYGHWSLLLSDAKCIQMQNQLC